MAAKKKAKNAKKAKTSKAKKSAGKKPAPRAKAKLAVPAAPATPKAPVPRSQGRVGDVMSRPAETVHEDVALETLAMQMFERDIKRYPVVDEEGRLVGIISRSDVAEHLFMELGDGAEAKESHAQDPSGFQVREVTSALVRDLMTRHVLCLAEEDSLIAAAQLMSQRGIHGAPVVTSRRLVVGMLSALDVLRWVGGAKIAPPPVRHDASALAPRARRILMARRQEIQRRFQRAARRHDAESEPDWVDQSSAEQQETVSARMADAEQKLVMELDAALRRIQEGVYGACVRCHEEIEPARLRVRPEAALCLSCAEDS